MKILNKNEVREKTGLSIVSIWRLEKSGEFPSRVQLGPRRIGWIEGEIEKWLLSRPRVNRVPAT